MFVEYLGEIGYVVLMLVSFGIGFGSNMFLKQLDYMIRKDREFNRAKDILIASITGFLHSWKLGLLVFGVAIITRASSPITLVNDLVMFFGLGLALPDIPSTIYNWKNRDMLKYFKAIIFLPILPEWVKKAWQLIEETIMEGGLEEGEEGTSEEKKELAMKKAEEIIRKILGDADNKTADKPENTTA